jgi:hypothetical protein
LRDFRSCHFFQRRHHLLHRHRQTGQVQRAVDAERCLVQFVTVDQIVDGLVRRHQPHPRVAGYRANCALPVQRFANDAAGEAGSRLVGRPGPHRDGRHAQTTPIDKLLAAIVVDQHFAHHFLCAIGALRRCRGFIRHLRGQIAAEDGNRAGKQEARTGAERARSFKNQAGGLEIDFHADSEIRLRLAADNRGEMKDAVGTGIDRRRNRLRIADVTGQHADARIIHPLSRHDIQQRDATDRPHLAIAVRQCPAL